MKKHDSLFINNNVSSVVGGLVPHWYDGIAVGQISDAAAWQEISGLSTARLPANSGYAFAVSDASANQIAVISLSDASPQGVITLTGSVAKVDLEDITSQIVGGVNYQYVMDMGNNGGGADSRGIGIDLRIFRFVEPTVTGSNISTSDYIAIDCVFPVGNPPGHRDAEASLVDENGKIFIIIKRSASISVYSLAHAASYSGIQTLVFEGNMTAIPSSTTVPLGATACYVVAACMSPNGKEILVKNYSDVYYFSRNPATQTVFQALSGTATLVPAYVGGGSTAPAASHPSMEPQGEALCYSQDGRDWYSCSEYIASEGSTAARFPLFKYLRCRAVPITVSFQDGVSPTAGYAGTLDTYIWDTNPNTVYGTDTTIVSDKAIGVESDQRKALVKWDLAAGSIPANAEVVGARIDLYIAQEGQGWTIHQMLIDWNESSTYNTLVGGVNADDVDAGIPEQCRNGVNLNTIQSVTVRNNIFTPSYYLYTMVQGWVNGAYGNYGVIIIATDIATGDGQQFASRQAVTASQRPKLTIRYIV